jgi:hypothetical protein
MGRWSGEGHYIINDVVWAVDSLFGDTDWHKLQLSSCSIAIKTTLRYPNEFSDFIIPMQPEKLVPLPSRPAFVSDLDDHTTCQNRDYL